MRMLHFLPDRRFRELDEPSRMPDSGVVWIDVVREDGEDWPAAVQALTGGAIEDEHLADAMNASHPSFHDVTGDYQLLVFRYPVPGGELLPLSVRSCCLLLFDRVLVSVRSADDALISEAHRRIAERRVRVPSSVVGVLHRLLDAVVDHALTMREPLAQRIHAVQDALLDPDDPSSDWKQLLRDRRSLARLQDLCAAQLDALDALARHARHPWNQRQQVDMRDLRNHVERVLSHAESLERDVESAVQLHFSAVAHSTNLIVHRLTVISAVFLPLTLMAGIWGMNFQYMPELAWRWGYPAALGSMTAVAIGALVAMRRRGWF